MVYISSVGMLETLHGLRSFTSEVAPYCANLAFLFPAGSLLSRTQPSSSRTLMMSTSSFTNISETLNNVLQRLETVSRECGRSKPPRLVAVAKTQPAEAVMAAYAAGQRHFGENYVQELVRKSQKVDGDVRWHFIGPLQSNKAKMLVRVKGLEVVESVDRKKIADALNRETLAQGKEGLQVMIQVNTSGEESKSGCTEEEAVDLARYVTESCQALKFVGLMTIGRPDYSERPEAFEILTRVRKNVAQELGRTENELELSMGMSGDFEAATRMGSTSVRIGSSIFGARDYSNKK